ncbi:MAG: hypothetical protein AAF050_01955 [Cyanobacteria bacterium J06649_5]
MGSALSKSATTKNKTEQLAMGFTSPVKGGSKSNPIDFDAIAADAPKGKEPKSLRVEKRLLLKTESLRGKTNLSFNEYVETALQYFNACLDEHYSTQAEQTKDPA